jgi:hypothetical protein
MHAMHLANVEDGGGQRAVHGQICDFLQVLLEFDVLPYALDSIDRLQPLVLLTSSLREKRGWWRAVAWGRV